MTSLTAVALLGGALLSAAPATAVGETCQGRPATIVGTDEVVQGTEGDDVVVTGSSTTAYTLGGDDLVCVSPYGAHGIRLSTGAGNDIVDASAVSAPFGVPAGGTVADLGAGVDRYLGSTTFNQVTAHGADDTVDASMGPAFLTLWISGPVGDVVGTYRGSGSGEINVQSTDQAIELELDGRLAIDGVTGADTTGFQFADVQAPDVVLRGNSADNSLRARGCDIRIDGASGDDEIRTNLYLGQAPFKLDCETKSRLSGGPGDDSVAGRAGQDRVAGNGGNDDLRGGGDADVLLGGGGNDSINAGAGRDVLRGDAGNDTLGGGRGPDVLCGNGGRDIADGQEDRDRCVAERERRCER